MWEKPKTEKQIINFDTNACGIFSVLNAIESSLLKLKPDLSSLGFNSDYNISDRFTAINVGGLLGNFPYDVIESIKKNGFIPEEDLPIGGYNQLDYYDKKHITNEMKSKAKKVLDFINIDWEWVKFTNGKEKAIKEALKECPLVGVIINQNGTTHAIMIPNDKEYFDSYEPYVKKLDINKIHYAIKVKISLKEVADVIITRTYVAKQTLGELKAFKNGKVFKCKTLELPWLDNQQNISCIPQGLYDVVYTFSPRMLKYTYELKKVQNRSGIRVHTANYFYQLKGCIALGDGFKDINKDGQLDVINSSKTIKAFEAFMEKKNYKLLIK